jgi:opacity protein-like surface antigen
MRSVKFLIAAGAATLLSSAAIAADMGSMGPMGVPVPPIAPPPAYYAQQGGAQEFGGWYLRGDIGFSNHGVKRLNNALDSTTLSQSDTFDFASANSFSAGGGFRFNEWLRADITGQFRGKASFTGNDINTFSWNGEFHHGADAYTANMSSWTFMFNGYVDLGTWWSITPFIGGGIGTSRVSIFNFRDNGLTDVFGGSSSSAFADTGSKWNLAWALHAGLAYKIAQNLTMELGYSYTDLGDGITGDLRTFQGVNAVFNPMTFKSITSHDLKLGVRWNLDCPPGPLYAPVAPMAPPLMRKG